MERIFLEVLNLSILAGCMVPAVIMVRFFFKRIPKSLICVLWMLVGVRLLCPFSMESAFSPIRLPRGVQEEADLYENQDISEMEVEIETKAGSGGAGGESKELDFADRLEVTAAAQVDELNKREDILKAGTAVWCTGVFAMAGFFIYSWYDLKRRIRMAVPKCWCDIKIYQCDEIATPFLFGIVHPKIYIPAGMNEIYLPYIIKHEYAHMRRKDHLIKIIAFLLLAVHWFNPCIWIAYKMLCRDIELACDERAVRDMTNDARKEYMTALLNCSVSGRAVGACPVAFGESDIKERVKNVMNYKKPTFIIVILGVIICAAVLLCFMTTRKSEVAEVRDGTDMMESFGREGTEISAEESTEQEPLQETKSEEEQEKSVNIEESVEMWAKAFCNRDGQTIRGMVSDEYMRRQGEEEMLTSEGWSTPWLWDETADIYILETTEDHAEILYYAWLSDLHAVVWMNSISYHVEEGQCYIDQSDVRLMEYICTEEEFYQAYPDGKINGTRMDYLNNGAGEALNSYALSSNSNLPLFEPDTAAIYLLNILDNPGKVETMGITNGINGHARVTFKFLEDGGTVTVTMIQPYGEDGIWIPQTDEEMSTD
ncbi:MAG: hypothetical protein HDQ97_00580 [Lachnospiraceae bacterium]|nr:hypothetical protein [Lachnospiraceae bacterium]